MSLRKGRKKIVEKNVMKTIKNELFRWICQKQATNCPLDRQILRERALELTKVHGLTDFKCSEKWLTTFLKTHGFSPNLTNRESPTFNNYRVWIDLMRSTITRYRHCDLFHVDELTMYTDSIPVGDEWREKLEPRNRATILMCCNSTGTTKLPLVICGSYPSKLTKREHAYYHNKSSRIEDELFKDWLLKLNDRMSVGNRKILLLLQRVRARALENLTLSNINLVFFPDDFPPLLRPLRRDVFHYVKMIYRQRYAERLKQSPFSWTHQDVLDALIDSWEQVPREIIISSFQRTRFRTDDCFLQINCDFWNDLKTGISFKRFVTFDDDLSDERAFKPSEHIERNRLHGYNLRANARSVIQMQSDDSLESTVNREEEIQEANLSDNEYLLEPIASWNSNKNIKSNISRMSVQTSPVIQNSLQSSLSEDNHDVTRDDDVRGNSQKEYSDDNSLIVKSLRNLESDYSNAFNVDSSQAPRNTQRETNLSYRESCSVQTIVENVLTTARNPLQSTPSENNHNEPKNDNEEKNSQEELPTEESSFAKGQRGEKRKLENKNAKHLTSKDTIIGSFKGLDAQKVGRLSCREKTLTCSCQIVANNVLTMSGAEQNPFQSNPSGNDHDVTRNVNVEENSQKEFLDNNWPILQRRKSEEDKLENKFAESFISEDIKVASSTSMDAGSSKGFGTQSETSLSYREDDSVQTAVDKISTMSTTQNPSQSNLSKNRCDEARNDNMQGNLEKEFSDRNSLIVMSQRNTKHKLENKRARSFTSGDINVASCKSMNASYSKGLDTQRQGKLSYRENVSVQNIIHKALSMPTTTKTNYVRRLVDNIYASNEEGKRYSNYRVMQSVCSTNENNKEQRTRTIRFTCSDTSKLESCTKKRSENETIGSTFLTDNEVQQHDHRDKETENSIAPSVSLNKGEITWSNCANTRSERQIAQSTCSNKSTVEHLKFKDSNKQGANKEGGDRVIRFISSDESQTKYSNALNEPRKDTETINAILSAELSHENETSLQCNCLNRPSTSTEEMSVNNKKVIPSDLDVGDMSLKDRDSLIHATDPNDDNNRPYANKKAAKSFKRRRSKLTNVDDLKSNDGEPVEKRSRTDSDWAKQYETKFVFGSPRESSANVPPQIQHDENIITTVETPIYHNNRN